MALNVQAGFVVTIQQNQMPNRFACQRALSACRQYTLSHISFLAEAT